MNKRNNKLNIGVFFGSRSPEHDVSIITGQLIISELKKLGYMVTPIYLSQAGNWYIDEKLGSLKFFTSNEKLNELKKMHSWQLELVANSGKMTFGRSALLGKGKKISIDVAFPAFHGANGEDGTVQGIFELLNVPYVGCDVLSSALAMDKAITKMIYRSEGILTTNYFYFNQSEWEKNKNKIIDKAHNLKWPVFVKPARLGSSVGIAKVKEQADLENACEVALHYDEKVVIEESVENMSDITCAVLGNDDPIPSLVQEAIFSGEHFSYEDKYLENGGAQLGNAQDRIIIPARLADARTKEVQALAVSIFKIFGCSGTARIDFLYDKQLDRIYANEINTLPGTLYHHLWEKSGIKISELLRKLIIFSLDRYEMKKKTTYFFDSDILKFANSVKLKISRK